MNRKHNIQPEIWYNNLKPAAPKDGELVKDELIGFYGDVKEHLTEGDIEDIKTLMKLRAELNRSKE